MKKTLRLIALCGLAMTAASTVVWAGPPPISIDLPSLPATGSVKVIVQYKHKPTQADFNAVTAIGGTLLRTMPHIEAAHYLVPNPH
jgi:hypothetical protein